MDKKGGCKMHRLGRVDVPARLAPTVPIWLGQTLCAIAVVALVVLMRLVIDHYFPGAMPYLLLSPGVLLATLVAGWRAGMLALVAILYLVWRHLELPAGVDFSRASHFVNFFLNAASGLLIIFVAEGFRSVSQRALAERTAKLEQRNLLYRELDHRVKNTLAMITSIIELERRRVTEPAAQQALADVTTRVDSIARAHHNLYHGDDVRVIDFGSYLSDLCAQIASMLTIEGRFKVRCDIDHVKIDRDRALAFGLIVNELAINAAKHNRDRANPVVVSIRLAPDGDNWRLSIEDDGPGLPDDFDQRHGLGRRLVEAFAQQARAQLAVDGVAGARFNFRFKV